MMSTDFGLYGSGASRFWLFMALLYVLALAVIWTWAAWRRRRLSH